MIKAFGIVNFPESHIHVEGLQDYRSAGAFSFVGRYRAIDFPISNMSNSGIDYIQVYVDEMPRSLVEHIGSGRHYNINSKRGKLQVLFSENHERNAIYDTDISAFSKNIDCIEEINDPYVVIAPSYMIYTMDFSSLLQTHVDSGADITLLYHAVDNANESFLNCHQLNLNRQKGVDSIERNRGNAKSRNIFMDTYVMTKELFLDLIHKAQKISSVFTLSNIVSLSCSDLDVRGVSHRGYFASLTDLKSYFYANLSLIDYKTASGLFNEDWPIYTRTNDSCPTKYFETANVKTSVISDGCMIEGTIKDSVIGRGCVIKKGAVIKDCVVSPEAVIGEDVHLEYQVVDKHATIEHVKEIVSTPEIPGYIHRYDTL